MKYELTEAAKEAAQRIAQAWNEGILDQKLAINIRQSADKEAMGMIFGTKGLCGFRRPPALALWLELGGASLIKIHSFDGGKQYNVLLKQELLNAVADDFTISEY